MSDQEFDVGIAKPPLLFPHLGVIRHVEVKHLPVLHLQCYQNRDRSLQTGARVHHALRGWPSNTVHAEKRHVPRVEWQKMLASIRIVGEL